jgi:hypothetical protein
MGRVASGRASGIKLLPQHSSLNSNGSFRMMLGKVAWCSDWLGQWRIKQVFVDVICLWPAGRNLIGIHATVWYLTIYPFQLRGKRPTRVILGNHGCKFTDSWKTAVKLTCVCMCVTMTTSSLHVILTQQFSLKSVHRFSALIPGYATLACFLLTWWVLWSNDFLASTRF